MSKIAFADKVALKADSSIDRVNAITDKDINEIKNSVNVLYDGLGGILLFKEISVTAAEYAVLNSVPKEIVAAPGSGIVLKAIAGFLNYTHVSGGYASHDIEISANPGVNNQIVSAKNMGSLAASELIDMDNFTGDVNNVVDGAALSITASSEPGAGSTSTLKGYIYYTVTTL